MGLGISLITKDRVILQASVIWNMKFIPVDWYGAPYIVIVEWLDLWFEICIVLYFDNTSFTIVSLSLTGDTDSGHY